jgi:uncharacterized protein YjbI with pentapeptide repeats
MNAELVRAHLSKTNLNTEANLRNTDLSEADLSEATLDDIDLNDAKVTIEQLNKVKSRENRASSS